jgi:hypothetical protein
MQATGGRSKRAAPLADLGTIEEDEVIAPDNGEIALGLALKQMEETSGSSMLLAEAASSVSYPDAISFCMSSCSQWRSAAGISWTQL